MSRWALKEVEKGVIKDWHTLESGGEAEELLTHPTLSRVGSETGTEGGKDHGVQAGKICISVDTELSTNKQHTLLNSFTTGSLNFFPVYLVYDSVSHTKSRALVGGARLCLCTLVFLGCCVCNFALPLFADVCNSALPLYAGFAQVAGPRVVHRPGQSGLKSEAAAA